MEICLKCRKPVEAKDHMALAGSRPISQIESRRVLWAACET